MEVNTVPKFWKNSGCPSPTPKALKFFEQYTIYGYQNDRYDPQSHQKFFEQDRMKNKRATAENVLPRADPIFWQKWP